MKIFFIILATLILLPVLSYYCVKWGAFGFYKAVELIKKEIEKKEEK